ncbi:hypothetical protein WJX81_003183 [Elliptochloris bilobata]|uniref:Uncharacterized protein n=1 Tax=Elliptochloris bilobata TaxID=381761 RepID=A0AAW1QM28_9CHLO
MDRGRARTRGDPPNRSRSADGALSGRIRRERRHSKAMPTALPVKPGLKERKKILEDALRAGVLPTVCKTSLRLGAEVFKDGVSVMRAADHPSLGRLWVKFAVDDEHPECGATFGGCTAAEFVLGAELLDLPDILQARAYVKNSSECYSIAYEAVEHGVQLFVTPTNVIIAIDAFGGVKDVKLTGFALAMRLSHCGLAQLARDRVRGTPGFVAPELLWEVDTNPHKHASPAGDILGLGRTIQAVSQMAWLNEALPRMELESYGNNWASLIHALTDEHPAVRPSAKDALLRIGEQRKAHIAWGFRANEADERDDTAAFYNPLSCAIM